MTEHGQALTASTIRYLLILRRLDREEGGIRCVHIAEKLGISKPSVHRMMEALCQRQWIQKKRYGTVCLTENGRLIADRYGEYAETVRLYFDAVLPPDSDIDGITCVFLAQIPMDRLETVCERIRNRLTDFDSLF